MKKILGAGLVGVGLLLILGIVFIDQNRKTKEVETMIQSQAVLQEATLPIEEEEVETEENYVPMEAPILSVEVQESADKLEVEVEKLAKAEEKETDKCDRHEKCEKAVEDTFQEKFEALLKEYEKYF